MALPLRLLALVLALAALSVAAALVFLPGPAPAQSQVQSEVQSQGQTGDVSPGGGTPPEATFNLFALEGFGQVRRFMFDDSYTERFGIEVPAPFTLSLPINDALDLISDGAPDSGFVRFTWVAGTGDDRRFVENLIVHAADWPGGEGGDGEDRMDAVEALIRDRVFAQATAQHGGGDLLAWGRGDIDGLPVVQAAGTYTDARWGPMLLRIVAMPNPGAGASYFVLNNISLDMVPIEHIDQTRSSLGGQTILSFRYLPEE